jgi:integrase/recombinase XerD
MVVTMETKVKPRIKAEFVRDLVPAYLDHLRARRLSPRTIRGYEMDLRMVEREIGMPLLALSAEVLVAYFEGPRFRELAAGTVAKKHIALRCFYAWVADIEPEVPMADRRPCRRLLKPKAPKRIRRHMTTEEAGRMLASLSTTTRYDARRAIIAVLLWFTGMRISEVVSVRIEWLRRRESAVRVIGKGDKERAIEVPEEFWGWVDAWLAHHPTGAGLLVVDWDGRPYDQDKARRQFRNTLIKAGVDPEITPHCVRHGYVTALDEAEVPLETIRQQAGHESLATTQNYLHSRMTDTARSRLRSALTVRSEPLAVESRGDQAQ